MKKMMMLAAIAGLMMVSCNKAQTTENTENNEEACCEAAASCCQEQGCLLEGEWTIEAAGEIAIAEDVNVPALTIAEGKVNGQTGCNSFFGDVKCCPKSHRVAFSNVGATKMMCPDSDAQEQAILKAINEAVSFAIEENVVCFKDSNDVVLMTIKKVVAE